MKSERNRAPSPAQPQASKTLTVVDPPASRPAAAPVRPGRELPSSVLTPPVPPPPPHLDDYESIIGAAQVEALRFLAADVKGKTVKMVNSTAVGGWVLGRVKLLCPLMFVGESP